MVEALNTMVHTYGMKNSSGWSSSM